MLDDSSTIIQMWLVRLQQGDAQAREELLLRTQQRLERFAHKLLHGGFVRLGGFEQTMDVVQEVNLRLLKGWEKISQDAEGNPVW